MARTSIHRRSPHLPVVLCALAFGCGGGVPDGRVALRLIDSDPDEYFSPERIRSAEELASWTFGAGVPAPWSYDGPSSASSTGIRLSNRPEHDLVLAEVPQVSYDAVAVEVRRIGRGSVMLLDGAGQVVAESRVGVPLDDEFRLHVLRVGRPTEGGLTLRVAPHRGLSADLRRVALIDERLVPELVARSAGRAWKVDRLNDVRNAVLSHVDHPVEWNVGSSSPGIFRAAVGPVEGAAGDVELVLGLQDGEGTHIELDSWLVEADAPWVEVSAELPSLQGSGHLLLGVRGTRGGGLGFWANPRLVPETPAESPRPDIVLISMDTLRADRMSLYGYERRTTPTIDAWAEKHSVVFEQALAAAPWTFPAHVSMMTGREAHRHGFNFEVPAPTSIVMLAERLREAGYRTLGFTGGGFVHHQWGFAQGFDVYRSYDVAMGFEDELAGNVDLSRRALDQEMGSPLFLFLHSYEVHNPYRARQPFFSDFSDLPAEGFHVRVDGAPRTSEGLREMRALTLVRGGAVPEEVPDPDTLEYASDRYDSGIAYMDSIIGPLLEELSLRERPTLVILTSDHGEMFGEHGIVTHLALYEETTRIPLVVGGPGFEPGVRVQALAGTVDVAPTILAAAGLEPDAMMDGKPLSMASARDEKRVLASYAATSNYGIALRAGTRWKYIFGNSGWMGGEEEELYDLHVDRREGVNLAPGSGPTSGFREQARAAMESAPGFVVRLGNTSSEPLEFRLSGAIAPNKFKRLEPGAPEARFVDGGAALVRLETGDEARFLLEAVAGRVLTIDFGPEGKSGGEAPFEVALEASEGETEALLEAVTDSFEVSVRVQGGAEGMSSLEREDLPRELREQLERLGYVN